MPQESALHLFKLNSERALSYIKNHKGTFISFVVFLFVQDFINFSIQDQIALSGNDPRFVEIGFQFFFLWSSVFFFHMANCQTLKREVPFIKVMGESILLLPGYILQSILWTLSFVIGLALLVLPGIYCGIVFYLAPMISILYPDYSGTTFTLAREFAHEDLKSTALIVILTGLIPFIPEGLLFLLTGSLKSIWGLIYSPLGGAVYLFCELIFLFFVFEKVEAHRNMSSTGAPSISSKK